MYTKILVALDGSDPSKRALHRAVILAEKFGSKLTLLTVFHRRRLPLMVKESRELVVNEIYNKYWGSVREHHVGILEETKRLMKKNYPKVTFEAVLVEGHPSVEICREAREREVDLVIVGNSGIDGIKGLVLGSTSKSVVDSCSRTVMVVK